MNFLKLAARFFGIFGKMNISLCKANAALRFILGKAINCSAAKDLYKSLHKGIEQRKTVYLPQQNFLKNPNIETDFYKYITT